MKSTPHTSTADSERVAQLAAEAASNRALSPGAQVSLERAVERLNEAIKQSDAEAQLDR